MAVTHSTSALNASTNAVTALIGAGGTLKFRLAGTITAPGTAAATLTFSATAFGAAAAGIATANAITSDITTVGNATVVANASIETSTGVLIVHVSVASSASDINMTGGLTINPGDTVSCSSLTYKAINA